MRTTILAILLLGNIISHGQSKIQSNAWLKMNGIIYFEKEQDVYTMYFIETPYTDLKYLLKTKDTIEMHSLGSPGDNVSDIKGFKLHLDKLVKFQTTSFLVSQENYQGLQYEDSVRAFFCNGYIEYVKGNRYNLSPGFKKVKLNNKETIFVTREFISINSFINIKNSGKNKIIKKEN